MRGHQLLQEEDEQHGAQLLISSQHVEHSWLSVPTLALSLCPCHGAGQAEPWQWVLPGLQQPTCCGPAEPCHPSESGLLSHMDRGQGHSQPVGKLLLLHLTTWNPAFALTDEESNKACGDGLTGGDRLTAWEHDQRKLDEPGSSLPGLA